MLPLDIDPKLAWALKFRESFPVDVNRAPREMLLRVPGLGTKAIDRIIASRRLRRLRLEDVARLTVSIAKVRPFIVTADWRPTALTERIDLRALIAPKREQLELFDMSDAKALVAAFKADPNRQFSDGEAEILAGAARQLICGPPRPPRMHFFRKQDYARSRRA